MSANRSIRSFVMSLPLPGLADEQQQDGGGDADGDGDDGDRQERGRGHPDARTDTGRNGGDLPARAAGAGRARARAAVVLGGRLRGLDGGHEGQRRRVPVGRARRAHRVGGRALMRGAHAVASVGAGATVPSACRTRRPFSTSRATTLDTVPLGRPAFSTMSFCRAGPSWTIRSTRASVDSAAAGVAGGAGGFRMEITGATLGPRQIGWSGSAITCESSMYRTLIGFGLRFPSRTNATPGAGSSSASQPLA